MKKLSAGQYEYKGYIITNHGYYQPDKCIWWEAVSINTRQADYHANTKRQIKKMIDNDHPTRPY